VCVAERAPLSTLGDGYGRPMRARLPLAGPVLAVAVLLTGCGGSDAADFCDSAAALESVSEEDQVDLFQELRDSAPDEIADDLDALVEVAESYEDGDVPQQSDFDGVLASMTRVQQYVADNCS